MSEVELIQGVLLTHGGMAHGMVDAVLQISGADADSLLPLSNQGKSPEALHEELNELLGDGPAVIFTDLPSGSCALTARVRCREETEQAVVFGVNLPMLLDFVFHRELPLDELVPRLMQKGRESLTSFPEYPPHADPALPS